jgi:hypothetical protein
MSTKYPKTTDELPTEEFYAILTPTSVTIPGDERSRTNPGHGYPEHSVDSWDIEVFTNKEDWQNEVVKLTKRNDDFKAVTMKPAKISTIINVQ